MISPLLASCLEPASLWMRLVVGSAIIRSIALSSTRANCGTAIPLAHYRPPRALAHKLGARISAQCALSNSTQCALSNSAQFPRAPARTPAHLISSSATSVGGGTCAPTRASRACSLALTCGDQDHSQGGAWPGLPRFISAAHSMGCGGPGVTLSPSFQLPRSKDAAGKGKS